MNWYNAIAEGYDELRGDEQRAKLREFKPYIKPEMRVLDVGFGTGISDEMFNSTVVGVEPSQSMLQSYDGDAAVFSQGGGAVDSLFDRDSFDAVLCVSTAHHFDNPSAVFRKIRGVLRPSGFLLVSVFTKRKDVLDSLPDLFQEKSRCRIHRDIIVSYQLLR